MKELRAPCPLGKKCEEAKTVNGEQILYRCPWHVKLRGKDPQSEQEIDEYRCAIAWMPILQTEHSLFERQTGAAVEDMRNAVVKRQELTAEVISEALNKPEPKLINQGS